MNNTFQAKRTYGSRELTALRRERVERTQTRVPSIHLQDSSEATARARKLASVLPESLPSYGNSTNMVKWRDCSVVQAMRAGSVYRAAALSRKPRTDSCTIARVPNPFLDETTRNVAGGIAPFSVFTYPKASVCVQPEVGSVRVPERFDLVERFGMTKNNNKVVMSNAPLKNKCVCLLPVTPAVPGPSPAVPAVPYIPLVGGSLYFNGTVTSYLRTPSTGGLVIGELGEFTIEWFQYMFSQNGFPRVFSMGTFNEEDIKIAVSIENGTLFFWIDGQSYSMGSAGAINTWTYFAISSNGENIKVFKDGVQLGETLTSEYNLQSPLPELTIGNETVPGEQSCFDGFITGFRWSTEGLYNVSAPIRPTAPLSAIASTTLLLNSQSNPTAFTDSSTDDRTLVHSNVVWYGL